MKNTTTESEREDGAVVPPTIDFQPHNLYRLDYYQKSTNARGVEYLFLYFKKQLTEKERQAYCVDICERRMWRMIQVAPAVEIVG